MDLLPTLVEVAGAQPPTDRHIDGISFANLLKDGTEMFNGQYSQEFDKVDSSSHRFLPFFCDKTLMAVRYGSYKLHLRIAPLATEEELLMRTHNGIPLVDWYKSPACTNAKRLDPPDLYNVEHDPGEQFPLHSYHYSEVVQEIYDYIEIYLKSMQHTRPMLLNRRSMSRKVIPCCNPPFCICVDSLYSKSICPVE